MSVYVGIDVRRKRSQVCVDSAEAEVDHGGQGVGVLVAVAAALYHTHRPRIPRALIALAMASLGGHHPPYPAEPTHGSVSRT